MKRSNGLEYWGNGRTNEHAPLRLLVHVHEQMQRRLLRFVLMHVQMHRLARGADPMSYVLCVAGPQRCSSVLGHINSLAEDDEWHCRLPNGHDDVCRASDGTTW
jgi:hypothetical protein